MKTDQQVDAIMAAIPANCRMRWCTAIEPPFDPHPFAGMCACLGCVQTGNKQVIAEMLTGKPWAGSSERISEPALSEHLVYATHKLTHAEWLAWVERRKAGAA